MKFFTVILVVILSLVLYPIAYFVHKSNLFLSNKHHHDAHCQVLNREDFQGLEDITVIYQDNDVVDLVGSVDPRRETWLNHQHKMGEAFVEGIESATRQSGLVLIRVLKKKCANDRTIEDDCLQVSALEAPLKDKTLLFQPHGIYFDKATQKLYVVNHAFKYGGDRIEVFSVKRAPSQLKDKKTGKPLSEVHDVTVSHSNSLVWAAGTWPPADFHALPHVKQGVAPRGSAYGVMNDITFDKINNRILVTQWKPFPLGRKFPGGRKYLRDELYPMLLTITTSPTMFLSCPPVSTAEVEPDIRQCVRSEQRYGLANGIMSNKRGDVIALMDLSSIAINFLRPVKLPSSNDGKGKQQEQLPTYKSIGTFHPKYTADNIELHSDNATHVCYTLGLIQRIMEAVKVSENRFATTSGGASLVCCPYATSSSSASASSADETTMRDVATDQCVEELLFLGDGASGKTQSGISVAVMLDAPWAGRNEKRLVLTGSWYDNGMGVCWV